MMTNEFKTQIFKTSDQWEKGSLFYRLARGKDNSVSPYSTPAFSMWLLKINGIKDPINLAWDECGLIYFIDKKNEKNDDDTYRIYRYDRNIQRSELISCIGGYGTVPGKFKEPKRIIIDKFTLWVLDAGNRRIQAFSKENYQIKHIIHLNDPVDFGLDDLGHLHVLDRKENNVYKILTYDTNGQNMEKDFDDSHLKDPVGLVISNENTLYAIDKSIEIKGFLKFTEDGQCSIIGDFKKISDDEGKPIDFKPSIAVIDRKGNIFVVNDGTGQIYEFNKDGSYIGRIPIPGFNGHITGLAVDQKGNLYAATDEGIAFFSAEQKFSKEKGVYYSRTLDSGIQDCQWHRLALEADIPANTLLEIYYHSSDDTGMKKMIDTVLVDPEKTIQDKASILDERIPWIEKPESFFFPVIKSETLSNSKKSICTKKYPGDNKLESEQKPRNMLFRKKRGRYLWLKLVFSTFDENIRPMVTRMKVFYPRISYLRYLPAIYQEDPKSKDFLERFLSIFETIFYDLEIDISSIFRYFDPDTVPENFLAWLASWLNLALEEEWPEDQKRYFIQRASRFYKMKGTPKGIEELLTLYTGRKPLILEHSKIVKPMVLNEKRDITRGEFRLGMNSILLQTPIRGFRLGDDSILGRVALRDTDILESHADPFLPLAHRFTVTLGLSDEEFTRIGKGIERILNDEKPAHTEYKLRIDRGMKLGMGLHIGINTRISEYKPISLGNNAAVGSGIIVMNGEHGGKVERHSILEKDVELI